MNLLDLLDLFNFIDRIEGLLRGLWYRDMGRTMTIEHNDDHSGQDYEDALRKRGIAVYGRGVTSSELRFKTKHRQARWAEYNLRRMRAPLTSRDVDQRNRSWAARHAPGQLPPAWSARSKRR